MKSLEDWLWESRLEGVALTAFDLLIHHPLLTSLESFGTQQQVHKWVRTLLARRTLNVRIRDRCKGKFGITGAVPQRSILGLLLILFFINDLLSALRSPRLFFGDHLVLLSMSREELSGDIELT